MYSLSVLTAIFQVDLVSRYQNVSLDFIGAKGGAGGSNNWSYKTCLTPVKMSPPANQHPVFYGPDVFARIPTMREGNIVSIDCQPRIMWRDHWYRAEDMFSRDAYTV